MQSADCGVRETQAKGEERAKGQRGRMPSLNGILYPSEMFIWGIGLKRPDSPVLGGILGNVVFC